MFGILAACTLIAIGIAWIRHQRKVEREARMSRHWAMNELPDHQAEERRRMGMFRG